MNAISTFLNILLNLVKREREREREAQGECGCKGPHIRKPGIRRGKIFGPQLIITTPFNRVIQNFSIM